MNNLFKFLNVVFFGIGLIGKKIVIKEKLYIPKFLKLTFFPLCHLYAYIKVRYEEYISNTKYSKYIFNDKIDEELGIGTTWCEGWSDDDIYAASYFGHFIMIFLIFLLCIILYCI